MQRGPELGQNFTGSVHNKSFLDTGDGHETPSMQHHLFLMPQKSTL